MSYIVILAKLYVSNKLKNIVTFAVINDTQLLQNSKTRPKESFKIIILAESWSKCSFSLFLPLSAAVIHGH